ncbi:hypothetical protein M8818_004176 [Zalaria obscura]|uniref:Uncharacterized protein n=1 Tax=Zalaria obscura TaxID=2024903 RepID=A0ACC3SD82_9PEZI
MSDFRNLQHYIASIRANPSADEYHEEGYVVLRQCAAEAQAVLAQPFNASALDPRGNEEQEKSQLRQVIVDASTRRFRAQKIYLRATAALRWINSRNAILREQKPRPEHGPALQQIANTLRAELASVTDARVELSLRSADTSQGKWIQEDPTLVMLQQMIRAGREPPYARIRRYFAEDEALKWNKVPSEPMGTSVGDPDLSGTERHALARVVRTFGSLIALPVIVFLNRTYSYCFLSPPDSA